MLCLCDLAAYPMLGVELLSQWVHSFSFPQPSVHDFQIRLKMMLDSICKVGQPVFEVTHWRPRNSALDTDSISWETDKEGKKGPDPLESEIKL